MNEGEQQTELSLSAVATVEKVGGKRRTVDDHAYRLDVNSKHIDRWLLLFILLIWHLRDMRPPLRFSFPRTGVKAIPRLRSRVYKILMAYGPNQPSKFLFAFRYLFIYFLKHS